MPQIYDMRPTALLPLRRKARWGIFRPKNPKASAGFEPAILGTKGQHATPRPPKPHFVLKLRYLMKGGAQNMLSHRKLLSDIFLQYYDASPLMTGSQHAAA